MVSQQTREALELVIFRFFLALDLAKGADHALDVAGAYVAKELDDNDFCRLFLAELQDEFPAVDVAAVVEEWILAEYEDAVDELLNSAIARRAAEIKKAEAAGNRIMESIFGGRK